MNISRKILDLSNWWLAAFVVISTVLAYLLKKNGYTSALTNSAVIIMAIGGLSMLTAMSVYGALENRFGKEDMQQPGSKISGYFKRVNSIFLLSQAIAVIGVVTILCMVTPYYPLSLLIPYIILFVAQRLKRVRSRS